MDKEQLTKEDLEKRIDEFKAELVNEHFPEVEEGKCIELVYFLNSYNHALEDRHVYIKGDESFKLLKNTLSTLDQIIVTRRGEDRVFLGRWNSGFDEQGRDWNK